MLRVSSLTLERNSKSKGMIQFQLNSETSDNAEKEMSGSIPNFLFVFLRWSGLVEDSDKKAKHRFSSRIFDILLFLICADVTVSTVINSGNVHEKLIVAYLSCPIVSAFVWYEMRCKRKLIASLLQNVLMVNSSFYEKVINVAVFINYFISLIVPVVLISTVDNPEFLTFFVYGYETKIDWLLSVIGILKSSLYFMLYPCATNIVAIFYISLCWRCSIYINNLMRDIAKYTTEEFDHSKQLHILKERAKICRVLQNIQTIFSLPMFLIIVANCLMCSTLLGGVLIKIEFAEDLTIFIFYFFNDILCVITALWVAGSVPVDISRFKETFHQMTHERLLYHHATENELQLKIDLFNEPDFVLTGCNILPFRRSTILTVIGTLLTYTVLVANTN
ncbi:uncharacterized protein NPIL_298341 [Nephila pilipes]|uniref:Gustatory receptor n=1 Tax=Nephila pilipes TaxID=299642 RepID=A0A8X6U3E3_NEPPI|nr:uncharacterized protein NPIL_298341 [Nephila pilipes]